MLSSEAKTVGWEVMILLYPQYHRTRRFAPTSPFTGGISPRPGDER
jgi:hypothetical protein